MSVTRYKESKNTVPIEDQSHQHQSLFSVGMQRMATLVCRWKKGLKHVVVFLLQSLKMLLHNPS